MKEIFNSMWFWETSNSSAYVDNVKAEETDK